MRGMTTSVPLLQRRRILLVDDHPIVRRGLAALINAEADLEVCGEAEGLSQTMRQFRETRPDLLVVDLSLENGSGLEVIKELIAQDSGVGILVSSMHDETLYAERALRAGARGYVNKDQPTRIILAAIRRVLDGSVYLSEQMTQRLLCRNLGESGIPDSSPVESLSDRELEVFERIGHGETTRQIAERLHLSPKTIETYREHIKVKLNLNSATELSRHAVMWVLDHS